MDFIPLHSFYVGSADELSNFISDFEKVVLFIKANNY